MSMLGLQPPSGGCVLKLEVVAQCPLSQYAATFGWLCVETLLHLNLTKGLIAATFGWLCVETAIHCSKSFLVTQPPSGGCVLKLVGGVIIGAAVGSHLRVAVC